MPTNRLSGSIPDVSGMTDSITASLNFNYNMLSSTLPASISLFGTESISASIRAVRNGISGSIPFPNQDIYSESISNSTENFGRTL